MMHDWEEKLCDEKAKLNKPSRKVYVVCICHDDGGLYPVAAFSDSEFAAGFINRQNELMKRVTKTMPQFIDMKFRIVDFVVDSNVWKEVT